MAAPQSPPALSGWGHKEPLCNKSQNANILTSVAWCFVKKLLRARLNEHKGKAPDLASCPCTDKLVVPLQNHRVKINLNLSYFVTEAKRVLTSQLETIVLVSPALCEKSCFPTAHVLGNMRTLFITVNHSRCSTSFINITLMNNLWLERGNLLKQQTPDLTRL